MNWSSTWSPLRVLIILLLKCGVSRPMMAIEEAIYPKFAVTTNHTALSSDLRVSLLIPPLSKHSTTEKPAENGPDSSSNRTKSIMDDLDSLETKKSLVIRVLLLDGFSSEIVGEVPLENPPSTGGNVTVIIPCGFFSRGGSYTLQLQYKTSSVTAGLAENSELPEVQVSSALDVKWPTPLLNVEPREFYTYPSETVSASLVYNGIKCVPAKNVPVPEYILQLIYCGSSVVSCDPQNKNRAQVLYFEEVKGFPSTKLDIILRCEFFGLAGNYALRLTPTDANPTAPTTSVYIKVDWSDKFVFNIHARSVYPCEGSGGVSVLFEYPTCRLQGDRVRVYGRLRANVASLAPPSTLHYVAELKAAPGKNRLTFECDIFTEKFIEYCFAYVSQAITGAMAEVKLDCIPTFPLQEGDGGWGSWSPWTPCSSSCVGGTRNRYRFCDTPPPRYGAKFCQGKAVETESCGGSNHLDLRATWNNADWECRHGGELAASRPEVTAEVGTKCRCGCVVNLDKENSRRILAASTQACPGRSFWLLQARSSFVVRLHLDQAQFPCPGQYFRARDGDSLNADLLIDIAFDKNVQNSGTIFSTNENLLLEFFSDEVTATGESCIGGFLAHATTLHNSFMRNSTLLEAHLFNSTATAKEWIFWLTPAHLAAASLLTLIFLISLFLALQYALRYRKYHIAEDLDNLSENSAYSESIKGIVRRPRAMSSATLISEVVSLVRLHRSTPKHAKLKATPGDVEDGYESSETQADFEDDASVGSITIKAKEEESTSQKTIIPSILGSGDRLSTAGVSNQPEVKYARPVKLRTLGPQASAQEEGQNSVHSQDSVNSTPNSRTSRDRCDQFQSPESKESSTTTSTTSSNTSTLRSGKESKDRRNRERLLQGPGSEFSLSNPEVDLELDYYDYNVANASAVPGSYLGMDPAFLVWIPPFLSGDDNDEINEDEEKLRASDIEAKLGLDLEGATLTPSEYRKMRRNDKNNLEASSSSHKRPDSGDSGENTSSDEIGEGRIKLTDRLLPIHRILEDSRIRVSEESLSSHLKDKPVQQSIIPNRLQESPKPEVEFSSEKSKEKGKIRASAVKKNSQDDQWNLRKNQRVKNCQDEKRKRGETSSPSRIIDGKSDDEDSKTFLTNLNMMNNQGKYRTSPRLSENRKLDTVNIPMAELSSRVRLPKMAEKMSIFTEDIQSPDYGIDTDPKEASRDSFYDLIRESEDKIKFADDDDELYDNKANV
ncbi:uncharacterized protein gogo [Prorops nasuta]|uniref:uncharacterized protein gogo n=1 Tax=Prorops nasuta TaxID=863751 RepID=UPI0034CD84A9